MSKQFLGMSFEELEGVDRKALDSNGKRAHTAALKKARKAQDTSGTATADSSHTRQTKHGRSGTASAPPSFSKKSKITSMAPATSTPRPPSLPLDGFEGITGLLLSPLGSTSSASATSAPASELRKASKKVTTRKPRIANEDNILESADEGSDVDVNDDDDDDDEDLIAAQKEPSRFQKSVALEVHSIFRSLSAMLMNFSGLNGSYRQAKTRPAMTSLLPSAAASMLSIPAADPMESKPDVSQLSSSDTWPLETNIVRPEASGARPNVNAQHRRVKAVIKGSYIHISRSIALDNAFPENTAAVASAALLASAGSFDRVILERMNKDSAYLSFCATFGIAYISYLRKLFKVESEILVPGIYGLPDPKEKPDEYIAKATKLHEKFLYIFPISEVYSSLNIGIARAQNVRPGLMPEFSSDGYTDVYTNLVDQIQSIAEHKGNEALHRSLHKIYQRVVPASTTQSTATRKVLPSAEIDWAAIQRTAPVLLYLKPILVSGIHSTDATYGIHAELASKDSIKYILVADI
ncbi:hypothetical protein K488DRAFT_69369 [Vararia minispora EC-137]|uniref:Uncharacterized protein n=1 Tax=Vararia minispora EC-137 TaxID=1314806 RepID=A0ACB8QQC5_9AGAM|nr:hypothetical protein K488DRAFT_69369 [Vararia minispora EC-137]